ncbi:MAG: BamA/TamA family outer membrane protein [Bacteroidota bacterium]
MLRYFAPSVMRNISYHKKEWEISMMYQYRYLLLFSLLVSLLMSCSPTKYLAEDELLVKQVSVSFKNPEKVNKKAQLKAELDLLARPTPNYGLGNFNLWIHNKIGTLEKQKGFKHWLKKTFGRAPQLYQPAVVERSQLILEKHLKDNGYFGATVKADTSVHQRQMNINYRVQSYGQFDFGSLTFPADTTPVGQIIAENQKKTEIDTNKAYSKLALDAERIRLTQLAGRNGFMDFQENYLFYLVDTTKQEKQANIYLKIENPSDSALHQPYYLGDTYVYPAFLLDDSLANKNLDTVTYKDLKVIQPVEVLRPKVIQRAIAQKKGRLINRSLQDVSVNHLLDLGVFKFVRLKYEKRDSANKQLLDRYFYLTPGLTQNVQLEFQVNNRSGSFLGTAASVQYSHNNLFGGAERFNVRLSGGVETQLSNSQSLINTVDLLLESNLLISKLLLPFKFRNKYFRYVPRTRINLGHNLQRRTGFYTINSSNLKFGYEWQQNERLRHQFDVLRINQLLVNNKSESFEEILQSNSRLNNSFRNVFIIGTKYTFTRNSVLSNDVRPYSFFRAEVGTSGNLVSLFATGDPTAEAPDQFLGREYAQFFKIAPDFRYYIPRPKGEWASRLYLGLALPYGNSNTIPYIEQFFVGGANSIRAFPLRGLGPGSFFDAEVMAENANDQLFDQTGDIQLELNVEYRFDIIQYLEGALFVDAGNVWLIRNNNEQPNGLFAFDRFFREIAVGTGFGLRLDFDFFVIRLDSAFPIRRPVEQGVFAWTFNDLAIHQRSWRQRNMVFNLAIGYPF